MAYDQAYRDCKTALHRYNQLTAHRNQLLAKLELRIARQAQKQPPAHHLPAHVYEIDGTWYHQIGHRQRIPIKDPTKG